MSNCELCGKFGDLVTSYIEGVKLRVCSSCGPYGKIVEMQATRKLEKPKMRKEEVIEVVISDYYSIIKSARDKKGLSQRDLALKLNEKESFISKLEQGGIVPSIPQAQKLERFLGINLITEEKISEAPTVKEKSSSLTIGDVLGKGS